VNAPPVISPPVDIDDGTMAATRTLVQLIDNGATDVFTAERAIRREHQVMVTQSIVEPVGRVGELLHRRVDRALAVDVLKHPDNAAAVSCTRGCAHCCHMMVSLSEPEARLAIDAAKAVGHVIDIEQARRQAPLMHYGSLPLAQRRCVMLRDDNDCAIYEHRPLACRAYRVVSPADGCDTEKHPNGRTLAWHTIQAEVIASASMRAFRHGSLAAFVATNGD
jgi:Fe-S-cluster containining protein